MSLRVVVVGAGAAGLSSAWAAAELGADVTVVERQYAASGSSGLSAGILNRQVADRQDRALRSLSMAVLDALADDGLLTIHRCGYLRLARTPEQWQAMQQAVMEAAAGLSRAVSADEVLRLVPGVRVDDVLGAMYGPHDGHVDGPELCSAYLSRGRSLGVRVLSGQRLVRVDASSSVIQLTAQDGTDVQADVVINAAGPWLGEVAELLGVSTPMASQRHAICIARVPQLDDVSIPTVQTYVPGDAGSSVYARPEGPGVVLAGLHSYATDGTSVDPDAPAEVISGSHLAEVASALADRFPGWHDATLRPGWTGIYPMAVDGRPVIGPHAEDPRIVSCGGLGGVGLTISGAVGRMAAQWAVHGQCDAVDFASSYLPDRLASRGVDVRI